VLSRWIWADAPTCIYPLYRLPDDAFLDRSSGQNLSSCRPSGGRAAREQIVLGKCGKHNWGLPQPKWCGTSGQTCCQYKHLQPAREVTIIWALARKEGVLAIVSDTRTRNKSSTLHFTCTMCTGGAKGTATVRAESPREESAQDRAARSEKKLKLFEAPWRKRRKGKGSASWAPARNPEQAPAATNVTLKRCGGLLRIGREATCAAGSSAGWAWRL